MTFKVRKNPKHTIFTWKEWSLHLVVLIWTWIDSPNLRNNFYFKWIKSNQILIIFDSLNSWNNICYLKIFIISFFP